MKKNKDSSFPLMTPEATSLFKNLKLVCEMFKFESILDIVAQIFFVEIRLFVKEFCPK